MIGAILSKFLSNFSVITAGRFGVYNYMRSMNPDSTAKSAALFAAGASNILNKTNSLVNAASHNYGCDDHIDCVEHTDQIDHTNQRSCSTDQSEHIDQ